MNLGQKDFDFWKSLLLSYLNKWFKLIKKRPNEVFWYLNFQKPTVLLAFDHEEAKNTIAQALAASELAVKDAGSLKRTREQITWTGGFAILN